MGRNGDKKDGMSDKIATLTMYGQVMQGKLQKIKLGPLTEWRNSGTASAIINSQNRIRSFSPEFEMDNFESAY